MIRKDGGAAFPCHTNPRPDHLADAPQGMSLRDYFAANAMQAMISTAGAPCLLGLEGRDHYTANAAYKMADAMLAARSA